MVRIVKDIYSKKVNNQILQLLKITPGWYFGYDDKELNFNKDQGLALRTFDDKLKIDQLKNFDMLNLFAFTVADIVCMRISQPFKGLKRVNYNFYHTLSKGSNHVDSTTPGCVSILYNLNKNDGYLEIDDKKYISEDSVAYVFDSAKQHRGVGSTNELRYNLNIIIHT